MLPVAALIVHAMLHTSFSFIDDAVTVEMSRASWRAYFQIGESGRIFPFYWISLTTPLKVFGEHPWALQLTSVAGMAAGVVILFRLVSAVSGSWSGVLASWLATATLACAENLYTLSKVESFQLALWLIALVCLIKIATGPTPAKHIWFTLAACLLSIVTMLAKETGMLLLIPAAVLMLPSSLTGCYGSWRRRVVSVGIIGLPLVADGLLVASRSLRSSSYLRAHLYAKSGAQGALFPAFTRDLQLGALMFSGLFFGLLLVRAKHGSARIIPLLITAQLAILIAFFASMRDVYPYFLLLPSFLAAGLMAASAFGLAGTWRWLARIFSGGLLVWGAQHAVFGASALSGWSWMYSKLNQVVLNHHPDRVFFLYCANIETLTEARLWWRGTVSQVSSIDPQRSSTGDSEMIALRDLRPGDWVIERFGPMQNLSVPLRDLQAVRPLDHGLLQSPGGLAVTPVARYRATYPEFVNRPLFGAANTTYIEWQIVRIDSIPDRLILGLDADNWMHEKSQLIWRGPRDAVIQLEYDALLPGPGSTNVLTIRSGEKVIALCRAEEHHCTFSPPTDDIPDAEGWYKLELTASSVFRPSDNGLSPDTRPLSFRFRSTTSSTQ